MFGKIFEKTKSKNIVVLDINGAKHTRNLKNFKFRIGAYGVLTKGHKILVQVHPYTKKYGLPGGEVKMDETINEALKREFEEETGLKINAKNIIGIEEQFFTNPDFNEDAHSLFLVYKVERKSGALASNGNNDDVLRTEYISPKDLNRNNTEKYLWNIHKLLGQT